MKTRIVGTDIAGTDYARLTNNNLLELHNELFSFEIIADKLAQLNNKQFPIEGKEIKEFLN